MFSFHVRFLQKKFDLVHLSEYLSRFEIDLLWSPQSAPKQGRHHIVSNLAFDVDLQT